MAGDLTALSTQWATYPSTMTTIEKLSAINGSIAPGPPVDVLRSEVKKILSVGGALLKMQAYVSNPAAATSQPCLMASNYLLALIAYEPSLPSMSDTLKTSDQTNLNIIQAMIPNLMADPTNGMTQQIMDQIMALINPNVPWWKANGFSGPIVVSDLIAAGDLF
ncbi:hypothetical protein ACRQ5Q_14990 [Bradyrhizobium sp. PMVTL-01]|uniref:hypothetical protein n=1 Tax=Bradyrhizobium sp. PMVTL-01 TaxID=3434999 RepID=UPI003F6E686C